MADLVAQGILTGTYTRTDPYPASYTILDKTRTDSSGNYGFGGVTPGTYSILEIQPEGYASTGSIGGTGAVTNGIGSFDTGSDTDLISGIVLGESQNSVDNDFGEMKGFIGTHIWIDNDTTPEDDS